MNAADWMLCTLSSIGRGMQTNNLSIVKLQTAYSGTTHERNQQGMPGDGKRSKYVQDYQESHKGKTKDFPWINQNMVETRHLQLYTHFSNNHISLVDCKQLSQIPQYRKKPTILCMSLFHIHIIHTTAAMYPQLPLP